MIRRQLSITGVVQGVGFRPNVARLAAHHGVTGLCGNDDNSVFVEAQGDAGAIEAFFAAVRTEAPPMASIVAWRESDLAVVPGETAFVIVASRRHVGAITLLPPDAAVCPDCLKDMADPANRRHAYPFTTCTNCGPRLSIIRDVPYDRPLTTMAAFEMCDACRREYEDPADRRFHAQPISCFDCGPDLWLEAAGEPRAEQPTGGRQARFATAIADARRRLRDGAILGVKGIGGFTLMCDARNAEAVGRLRTRKRRPGKPLAVMAGSVEAARRIADLDDCHVAALTSREAPIVLAPMSARYDLAPQVAPGLDEVGVMLPYAPLHRLLLGSDDVLVATSANSSSKPLTYRDDDARRDLAPIVDALLMHDREIHVPVEDSVVMADGPAARPIRRSRGYAPLPVWLGGDDRCVLAVGAELKNTFALTRDGMAFLSAHIGDMGSLETQKAFEASVGQMLTAHRRTPELVVTDKHPGYATHTWGRRYAERLGVPLLEVQHHHAHALSLLAENPGTNGLTCVVLDGTGYGDDGTIWGGEMLRLGAGPLDFERLWHLPGFWLPGGDSAIRRPWKSAAGLASEYGIVPTLADGVDRDEWALVRSQLDNHVGLTWTTSAGRLFDAAASLLGLRQSVTYEGQAAMELEAAARLCHHDHGPLGDDVPALVAGLVEGTSSHRPTPCLARQFHETLAHIIAQTIYLTLAPGASVGLTGGVFANRLLTGYLEEGLVSHGYRCLRHQIVPPNDGGLALGQALAGISSIGGS